MNKDSHSHQVEGLVRIGVLNLMRKMLGFACRRDIKEVGVSRK